MREAYQRWMTLTDLLKSRQLIRKPINRTYLRCGIGSVALMICYDSLSVSASADMFLVPIPIRVCVNLCLLHYVTAVCNFILF